MNNNLYEFGGLCDVIIRCSSERTIGGKSYKKNEPYTILEDVYVDLQYNTNNTEEGGRKTALAARVGFPHTINIRGLTLTNKINNLIATKTSARSVSKVYDGIAYDGKIYLPEPGDNIFVFKGNSLIPAQLDETKEIIYGELEEGTSYKIFYETIVSDCSYELETPQFGYFKIEVIGKGNTDKKTKTIYLSFPACSLVSTPVFNFVNGNILNSPLQFKCIYANQEMPYFNVEQ